MKEKIFYNYKDVPFEEIKALPDAPNKKGCRRKGKTYVNAIAAFDIETTKIPNEELAVMFVWQFHIHSDEFEYTILGRTWDEFKAFMACLYGMLEGRTLMVFVHNLNYEFSYIKTIIKFTNKDGWTEIFSTDPHHPVYAMSHDGTFEWRDSYILLGTSLDEATKGLPHHKLDDFDYTKKRFSWTKLSDEEYQYCINDVFGLCEAILRALKEHNDTLYSLPLTSTGYIRRDIKRLMYTHTRFNDFPGDSFEVYEKLRKAFRGGNTHANRFFAGDIQYDVTSYDRSSSYPDVMVNDMFPITKFEFDGMFYLQHLDELTKNGYAYLVEMKLTDIELKDEMEPLPYMSVSKCYGRMGLSGEDNGRLLAMDQCHATFTDLDWMIFREQYKCKAQIIALYRSKYGYLPDEIRNYIKDLYQKKTSLKNVAGMEDVYRVSKTLINGCFGLAVQKIENIPVDFDETTHELVERDVEYSEDEYYGTIAKRPMPYRWGCWVAAWGRWHLQKMIDIAGPLFVYADTDSCKMLPGFDQSKIDELNQFYIDRSTKNGAYATDPNGNVHYMGVYENEGTYDEFITMGSKKYATKTGDKIEITVAGVPKKEGSKELKELGGLKAFKPGTVFNAGKLRPVYNDNSYYGKRKLYDCNGETGEVEITSNVCLVDVQYKLGYSEDYGDLLEAINNPTETIANYLYYIDKFNLE